MSLPLRQPTPDTPSDLSLWKSGALPPAIPILLLCCCAQAEALRGHREGPQHTPGHSLGAAGLGVGVAVKSFDFCPFWNIDVR